MKKQLISWRGPYRALHGALRARLRHASPRRDPVELCASGRLRTGARSGGQCRARPQPREPARFLHHPTHIGVLHRTRTHRRCIADGAGDGGGTLPRGSAQSQHRDVDAPFGAQGGARAGVEGLQAHHSLSGGAARRGGGESSHATHARALSRASWRRGPSHRLCRTRPVGRPGPHRGKIDKYLSDIRPHSFQPHQKVDLLIANTTELGFKAIIDNSHWGVLYKDDVFQRLSFGQTKKGFIKNIRPDGKIDLSLQGGKETRDKYEKIILIYLQKQNGFGPVHDKSDPQLISRLFGMSKGAFKKAIGGLYRKRIIRIEKDGIRLID